MSTTTSHRSFRSMTNLFGVRSKRAERVRIDRNTSPTDFVLRDYRYVR